MRLRRLWFAWVGLSCLMWSGAVVADDLPGYGSLSGAVTAPSDFVAAQVHARHTQKHILYAVYTSGQTYRAVNMFPGTYEVTVQKKGFSSEPQQVEIRENLESTLDFVLSIKKEGMTYTGSRTLEADLVLGSYDEVYVADDGRDLVEKWCVVCHGVNFLPRLPQSEEGWEAALDFMLMPGAFGVENGASMMPPNALGLGERERVVTYLSKHFGEEAPMKAVTVDAEYPLDEEALGKAQFIEYLFPNTEEMPNRWTQEAYFDADGNVWMTERGVPSAITRLDPRTGVYRDYMNPDPKWSPHGIVVDDDGYVWWAGRSLHLARLNPKSGDMRVWHNQSPGWHGHTPSLDSKGNVWFSMLTGNRIGKWDKVTDELTIWESPSPNGRPYGFFVSDDDKIWYAEFHACNVVMFDPETEEFTTYESLSKPCTIRRLGIDSKGTIWYGVFSAGMLGRIDPKTGEVTERKIPAVISEPYDVWADPDDNMWISDGGQGGVLIRFNTHTEKFTFYPSPRRTDFPKVTITRDGAIWYAPRMVAMTRGGPAGAGVLYPDKDSIKTLGAYK